MKALRLTILLGVILLWSLPAAAQNPLSVDQFTADPTARVFEGRVYVYPSHDVDCGTDWFCMKDYHVYSSENLVDWTDHGVILDQKDVPWVDATSNTMWAPDAHYANGKYYFYFPSVGDSTKGFGGRRIGVATSDTPYGPFTPEPTPIEGIHGIDPNILIDTDGQAYIYWALGRLMGAKLKDNMLELASEPQEIMDLPEGFKEGPFVFERNGIYYFTFPHVIEKTEALVYGMGDNPLGPFEYKGIIMDEHPSECWTNHHSMVEYDGQWYLFYHHNDRSPHFDKNRSMRADSLFFNPDGTIQQIIPSERGVGLISSDREIHLDRHTALSQEGVSIAFLDSTDTFAGWKARLESPGAWVTFNSVTFSGNEESLVVRALTSEASTLHLDVIRGSSVTPVHISLSGASDWQDVRIPLESTISDGVFDLRLSHVDGGAAEIDWIRFE